MNTPNATPALPPVDHHTPLPRSTHWTLFLLMLVYTMNFTDRQIIGILMQPIKTEFGVSDTAMGLLSGLAFGLFYSVLGIPFARYADRANRRNFIAWCCGSWSLMTAVCGMATGFWSLTLARIGVAVGEAGGNPPAISMIADHYPPHKRGRAMSVFMLGPQLGIIFGLGLGGWIAHHYGWRAAFYWMAVPGLVIALLLRVSGTEPVRGAWDGAAARPNAAPNTPSDSLAQVLRTLWQSKAFVRVSVAGFMLAFTGFGIGVWTPSFLVRSHGLSLKDAGAVMGVLGGLAAVLGTLSSGWLSDRLARKDPRWRLGVPILGSLMALPLGLAFFAMPASTNWVVGSLQVPPSIVWYVLFAITTVWWMAPAYAVLSEIVAPDRRSTAMALFNLGLTLIGGGLGPLVVGSLSDGLTASFGQEALRWALAGTMSTYILGVIGFVVSIKPYTQELARAQR